MSDFIEKVLRTDILSRGIGDPEWAWFGPGGTFTPAIVVMIMGVSVLGYYVLFVSNVAFRTNGESWKGGILLFYNAIKKSQNSISKSKTLREIHS